MPDPVPLQTSRLRRLLHEMVDIYSPSGKEEEILSYLRRFMKKWGLPAVKQTVDDSRYNLLVMPRREYVPLALIGHIDTVAAYDLDDYSFSEDGDTAQGLGTADMKGGCAALIEAYTAAWHSSDGDLPAALVLVVGEEEEGDGAKTLVEEYHFPWAVVGEPTNLNPCLGHYGYLELQLNTRGRRQHASLANLNPNPIEHMLNLLLQLTQYMKYHCPEGVYNIRAVLSPQAGFAVPDWCESWMDIHLPPNYPIGEISLEFEEMFDRIRQETPQIQAEIRIVTVEGGFQLPEKGPLVELLQSIYERRGIGWTPQAFPSHSDANALWASGVKSILLGPGDLAMAHAPEESVPFSQVRQAAEIYFDLIMGFDAV